MSYIRSFFLLSVTCGAALQVPAAGRQPAVARQKAAYFQAITLADGAPFVIRLQRPEQIREAREILKGDETRRLHISGIIVKAPAPYNRLWRFHLDPDSIEFFGTAAEVCDAATVLVERDLDEVGGSFLPGNRWCPWSSRLMAELNSPSDPVLSVVSAASLSEVAISPSSLASVLGEDLTNTTESAQGADLPSKLAGVQVELRRQNSSQSITAPLLLASPERVNFIVPDSVSSGLYTVRLVRDNQRDLEAATRVESVAPGVFFGEADNERYLAGSLLRVRGDGSRSDEVLLSVDAAGNYVPVPITFGPSDERLYLSLYGSGIGSKEVTVSVGSETPEVLYSGPQGGLAGLDQINIELRRSLASKEEAEIVVSARNDNGHRVQSAPVKVLLRDQQ